MARTPINILIVLILICLTNVALKKIDTPVDLKCLNCLCQATSACDLREVCVDNGCGTYRITNNYWKEAGKPTINNESDKDPQAFINCANNPLCTYYAVQRYIAKYKKDCNGDGVINCDDFVAIHKLGRNCGAKLPETYKERYDFCSESLN